MADVLPSPIPPIIPPLSGPAFSFSQTRKELDKAADTIDGLATTIKKDIIGSLMPAAREGGRLETKALKPIGGKLQAAQQLLDGLGSLVSDDIVGKLAQAVATVEDYSAREVSAASQGSRTSQLPSRATVSGDVVPGLPVPVRREAIIPPPPPPPPPVGPAFFGPLLGENNPGLNPPGPCPMIDQPTWEAWQKQSQAIADVCNKDGGLPGEQFTGNWWRCTEDCCVTGPVVSPDLNPPVPVAKYFDFGIDGFASCARKGFAWFITQWNQKAIQCGQPAPIDCSKFPFDPRCPADCKAHPEDPRCPVTPPTCPPPCINLSCPPPVINVPPCPPLELPSCIQIDLCDWDKFCKFIKDCLTQSKEDCALDNETAYTYKDCDGKFGQALKGFLGNNDGGTLEANTLDDLITQSTAPLLAISAADFSRGGIPI